MRQQQQQQRHQQPVHTTTKAGTMQREIVLIDEEAESESCGEGAFSGPKRGDYICSINHHNHRTDRQCLLGCRFVERRCSSGEWPYPHRSLPHDALCV